MHHSDVFIPVFAEVLPSVLDQLLAPTLAMRSNALHALGGFALGFAQCTPSIVHEEVTSMVIDFLLTPPDAMEKPPNDKEAASKIITPIVRTLRTTLVATSPKAAAQGPVWAWCVLACFTVLLGPALFKEEKVMRAVMALQALGMRHSRSSIRGLGCLAWRPVTWAYMQQWGQQKDMLDINAKPWLGVRSVLDLGAGVSIIGALLATDVKPSLLPKTEIDPQLVYAIDILSAMSIKGGLTCKEAMDTLSRLVSGKPHETKWDPLKLLPTDLFSTINGLQAADFTKLAQVLRPILNACPGVEDVRPLTTGEIADARVWLALADTWKDGLKSLQMSWEMDVPVSC